MYWFDVLCLSVLILFLPTAFIFFVVRHRRKKDDPNQTDAFQESRDRD